MKKLIFVFVIMFLFLTSSNVYAYSNSDLVLLDSGLTDEQKEEYIKIIKESSYFLDNKDIYPYYSIIYANSKPLSAVSTEDRIHLFFYDSLEFNTSYSSSYYIKSSSIKYSVYYQVPNNQFYNGVTTDTRFMYNHYTNYDSHRITRYELMTDYILETNFSVYYPKNFNLYDTNYNLIGSYTIEDDITKIRYERKPIIDDDTSTEDILDAEDMLYGISKKLLGPLPIEFEFLYSVVTLILGVVLILVVISPFIILIRWLM